MAARRITGLIASIAATLVAIGMLTSLAPLRGAAIGFDARQVGWIAAYSRLLLVSLRRSAPTRSPAGTGIAETVTAPDLGPDLAP